MPTVTVRGLGGGGAMFSPQISPWPNRPDLLFVACDMSGLYRSPDFGATWELLDQRVVRSWMTYYGGALDRTMAFSVAFHPSTTGFVVAYHPAGGLRKSLSDGANGTWVPFDLALPMTGGFAPGVSAATFTRDGRYFLVGTPAGIYRGDSTAPAAGFTLIGTAAGGVSLGRIFTFVTPTNLECFATNGINVFRSIDAGANWTVLADPQQGHLVESIAGANDGTNIVLYASVSTDPDPNVPYVGGVRRLQITPGLPAPTLWTDVTANLHTNPSDVKETKSRYRMLGVADQQGPNVVYVAAVPGQSSDAPGPTWAVYKGQSLPPPALMDWTGVYDGYQTHVGSGGPPPIPRYVNVEPGWIDEREHSGLPGPPGTPPGLGWAFGGPASGFTVDPKNAQRAVYTNFGVVDTTVDGGASWQQKYSRFVNAIPPPIPADERWVTTGLNVTTSWRYFRHPTNRHLHFICYTDIGFGRSEDAGVSWRSITPRRGSKDIWANFYDLAFESGAGSVGRIWAAVSTEHDIPHDKQIDENKPKVGIGQGDILVSTNDGADWTAYGSTGLASGPVVSLVYRRETSQGVLYACVWGSGVYRAVVPPIGTAPIWDPVGDLKAGPTGVTHTHPHCARIEFDGTGTLYCVVAADKTGGFKDGGLYSLTSPETASATTAWTKLSGGLETLIAAEQPGRRTAPIDFALDPVGGGVVYVATASFSGTNGGGGVYQRDANGNWTKLPVPFEAQTNNYNDGLQAFAPFFVGNILFVATTSHGTWMRSASQPAEWREYTPLPFLRSQRVTTTIDPGTGTIDRTDGDATLWFSTFGGGAWAVMRQCYFVIDRSVFSRDEVEAVKGTGAVAPFDGALFVVLDGFQPIELTTKPNPTRAEVIAEAPQVSATLVGGGGPQGFTITCTDVLLETGPLADGTVPSDVAQRFTFVYKVEFTSAVDFPPIGGSTDRISFDLSATKGWLGCTSAAALALTTQPAPYMIDVDVQANNPPWLSTDLRVFKVREGEAPVALPSRMFPNLPNNPTDADIEQAACSYISNVIANMNDAAFEAIKGGVDQDVLRWSTFENTKRVFNFALARVRYRAQTLQAIDVRVFFRLFKTAATGLNYDPATSYRTNFVKNVPLLGWRQTPQGNEITTVPCFRDPRVDTAQQLMDDQPDSNISTFSPAGGMEVHHFYGCWLDFNQSKGRFPDYPSTDGQYGATPLKSIQMLVKDEHQCLVAEIYYSNDPTLPGDAPGTSDNLAQRNLVIDPSANPGSPATRTVRHTLEIRSSEEQPDVRPSLEKRSTLWRDRRAGDELIFRWGNLPRQTRVTLHMPERVLKEILRLVYERSDNKYAERVDANTLHLPVLGDITSLPLPPRDTDIPTVLMMELPAGVRAGQTFSVVIQQTSARAVIGTVEWRVPVRKMNELLLDEERRLALLRHGEIHTSPEDRWAPIVRRSVELSRERVDGFGGDSGDILSSSDGAPRDTFAYDFRGFFPPIQNLPTINDVSAGRAIPVKFSLVGNQGLEIFAREYPKSQQIPCDSGILVRGDEPTASPGGSGLSYDPAADQYTYIWKTERTWARTCRQLVLKLRDGSFHRANFRFA